MSEPVQPPDSGTSDLATPTAAPVVPPVSAGSRMKRLGVESLVYGLSTILGRFLNYLLVPFYVSQFTAAENGVQNVVYALIPLVAVLFMLGLAEAYMRTAAGSIDGGEATDELAVQRAFSMAFGTILFGGAALVALGLALTPWAATRLDLPPSAIRYLLGIIYSDALLLIPMAHLRLTNRSLRYATLRLVFVGLNLALNIGLVLGAGWGVEAVFFANLAANVALIVPLIPLISRLFRPGLLVRRPGWRALWTYALPLVPATFAGMLVENADRLVLQQIDPATAHAAYGLEPIQVVGIYSFGYKLGVVMLLVVQMFRMAWTPFSLTQARQPDAPDLFARVLTGLVTLLAAVFLGVALLLPPVARLPVVQRFPSEAIYWLGLEIVPIILLGYVLSGVYAVVTAGLYIEKRTAVLPWITGAGALVNVGICLLAAPRFGMMGVAWATPVAYGLMAALAAWQAGRVYPVPYAWGRLLHLALVTGALFGLDRWLTAMAVPLTNPLTWLVKVGLLLALPVALWTTRFFRPAEWAAFTALVRRRKPVPVR